MSVQQIAALPVNRLTEKDAHLYLWFTNAFAVEAHEVCRAWGFEPKTIITWAKVQHEDPSKPSMKTGYYFRGATEHVLFGVKGSLKTQATLSTLFIHPRINTHSEKPEKFYTDVIEKASPGPYLELFARRRRPGWRAWGNQLPAE